MWLKIPEVPANSCGFTVQYQTLFLLTTQHPFILKTQKVHHHYGITEIQLIQRIWSKADGSQWEVFLSFEQVLGASKNMANNAEAWSKPPSTKKKYLSLTPKSPESAPLVSSEAPNSPKPCKELGRVPNHIQVLPYFFWAHVTHFVFLFVK